MARARYLSHDFRSHYVRLKKGRMHYLDEGRGPVLLMLHGNPSWSFFYRDLVAALSGEYRVIAPDHLGCGWSETPSPSEYAFDLARRVQDLEEFVERLQLSEPITLFLHDWGGLIGSTFAGKRPGQIARLVVMNTAGFLLPEGHSLPWILRWARRSRLAAFLILRFNAFAWAATFLGTATSMPSEVREGYLAPYGTPEDRMAILKFIQDIPAGPGEVTYELIAETERRLTGLQHVPLLILWGDKDLVFDGAFRDKWADLFPDAEVHRFAEAGHYVLEDVSNEAIPLIRRFLKSRA